MVAKHINNYHYLILLIPASGIYLYQHQFCYQCDCAGYTQGFCRTSVNVSSVLNIAVPQDFYFPRSISVKRFS